jgi:hypothetical protein
MTPSDVQQELRDQLTGHGVPENHVAERFDAHKRRRDAAIDAATSSMPMRVHRALNARPQASVARRLAPWAYSLSAAAAVVILFLQYAPQPTETADVGRDTATVSGSKRRVMDRDVDVLVDELLRRNGQNRADWTVTDGDVDQLLGDLDIDL